MTGPRIINIESVKSLVGAEVAVSDWIQIDQEAIDRFAEVTDDRQWIHTDQERAGRESPYKTTIVHGFLTLSMLSKLFQSAVAIDGISMSVNYGFNRVRFPSAVLAGEFLRARFTLKSFEEPPLGIQIVWQVDVERRDTDKPALAAEWIMRWYQ